MINPQNWKEFLGKRKYYQDYVDFFENEVKQKGVKRVIKEYFAILVEGISGAAFHPTIHLGYGFEGEYTPNVVDGLAYMSFAFNSLGKVNAEHKPANSDPNIILKRVQMERKFDRSMFEGIIHFESRMKKLIDSVGSDYLDQYDLFVPQCSDSNKVIDTLTLWTLEIFARTGYRDFFLLHGVTAFRSLKAILNHIDDNSIKLQSLRYFWRAHLCVYIIQRRPPLNFNNEREVFISWDDVITEALTLSDEHVIKVVMVCKKEADDCSRRHSDNLTTTTMAAKERRFLQIAANTVALIKKFGYTE
jgi:hypothetical protein